MQPCWSCRPSSCEPLVPGAVVAEGGRTIPTSGVPHPLADQVSPPGPHQWIATETRAPVVALTQARASLLTLAARDSRRPVLVSDATSALTPALSEVWQRAGGAWVVREVGGGLRNGFTGRRLERFEDAWLLPPPAALDEVSVNHLRLPALETMEVTVLLSARHPARAATVLGAASERLVQAVDTVKAYEGLSTGPLSWGPHEPVGRAWDREALTRELVADLPQERAVVLAAAGVTGLVSVQRTRHGLEELTHLHLDVGPLDVGELDDVTDGLGVALEQLCATAMPLVGLVLARPAVQGLLVTPVLTPPAVPLALLVGAPAVRSFGLDVAATTRRFAARAVGRPRLPALLVDLSGDPASAWAKLDEVLATFDPDRLSEALGLVAGPLDAARPRAAGGVDAQP